MNKKLKELQNTKERIKFAENAIESSQLKIQKEKEEKEYFKERLMERLKVLDDPKFYIKFLENATESSQLKIQARFCESYIRKHRR